MNNTIHLMPERYNRILNPYDQGKTAAGRHESPDANPFTRGSAKFYAWRRGFFDNLTEDQYIYDY